MQSKINKYERKLKRNRNENDVQNIDNQECDLGKYRDIEIKEMQKAMQDTYNISTLEGGNVDAFADAFAEANAEIDELLG